MRVSCRLVIAVALLASTTAHASDLWERVYPYQRAEKARQLARRECKPLVIHFVPDSQLGAEQLESFYAGRRRVPDAALEKVVVVGVPREKYGRFAQDLGVMSPAGFRTISAYDLSPVDENSVPTVRTGFR